MAELPISALDVLLSRMADAGGRAIEIAGDELARWPHDEVDALKSHGVLASGKPVESSICPGCERACYMPVQELPRPGQAASLFIVCDKPTDINRVSVAPAALERWRMTAQGLADALARLIGSDSAAPQGDDGQRFRLGLVKGRRDRGTAYLRSGSGAPHLEIAGHDLELSLFLAIRQQSLVLDVARLVRCVDAPASGVGAPAEAAKDRRERLANEVAKEKAKRTRAFNKVVAEREGISVSRLKQLLPAAKASQADWMGSLLKTSITSSEKPKR